MSMKGKLVGSALGFVIGGPLGAILGGAIGHNIYDREDESVSTTMRSNANSTQNRQAVVFLGIFSLLGKLSKADGKISKEEINAVQEFIKNNMKLQGDEANMAMNVFFESEKSSYTHFDYAKQVYSIFRSDRKLLTNIINILVKVAASDGNLDKNEEGIILDVCTVFNISQTEYKRVKAFYIDDSEKYYKILNVSKNASDQEIKKQYRKLISEYHPDKIVSKNLPEEFITFAHDKFREIQEAYEAIKKERGMS